MRRRGLAVGVVVCIAVAAVACAVASAGESAPAPETLQVPETVQPQSISLFFGPNGAPIVEGHTFRASVLVQGCPGPTATIDHVALIERPKTAARPYKSAVVTVFIRRAAYTYQPQVICAAILGPFVPIAVKTKRPASRLIFFDGSTSPPTRIFPRPLNRQPG